MIDHTAIELTGLTHRFGQRTALENVSFSVLPGELFAVLGPNGGGKTTLFRLLSTLLPIQQGLASVFGRDVQRDAASVRQLLGVVFQNPSLDKKLTVAENLAQHAALYGLSRRDLAQRMPQLLDQLGIADRRNELVETLSGGLQRRVEIAKALLHQPPVLLMDEPTTGLDPAVRSDLWRYLTLLQKRRPVTIVFTTHLLEEADRTDRLAILDRGQLVCLGGPTELCAGVARQSVLVRGRDPEQLAETIRGLLDVEPRVVDGVVRWEAGDAADQVRRLVADDLPGVRSVTAARATLEDVFIAKTGHRFWGQTNVDP